MGKFKISDHDKAILGRNIKSLRKAKGWSQDDLAYEIGACKNSQSFISNIESARGIPNVFFITAIAKVFGTTVEYLCTHGKRHDRAPRTQRQIYEAQLKLDKEGKRIGEAIINNHT